MTSLEEYSMSYEIFLAENEMMESLLSLTPLLKEDTGLTVITEGIKDAILNFLHKIADGLSFVWNKFKSLFTSAKNKSFLKLINPEKLKGGFTVTNYPNYDFDKMKNINIVPFNYEEMKSSLGNKSDFMDKYYPNLKGEGSVKDVMENIVITDRSEVKCDNKILTEIYYWCIKDYSTIINDIEDDLKKVNDSNKNIEKIASTITTQESYSLIESFLTEDFGKKAQNKEYDNDKVEIKDDEENKDDKNNGPDPDKLLKEVATFAKVSTEICTAKMNITKDCCKLYIKILHHAYKGHLKSKVDKKAKKRMKKEKLDIEVDL